MQGANRRASIVAQKNPIIKLPELGRTATSFGINMENASNLSPVGDENLDKDPMAVTAFNKRSRSVAPSELSITKNSTGRVS